MYSDIDIKMAMERGHIDIEDFDTERLNANSYDVRLGIWFYEVAWARLKGVYGPIFIGPVKAEDGEQIKVPVGGTLLAMTKDVVHTRHDIMATMKARSSVARVGLTVCKCAGLGDVGYSNHWTLELSGFVRYGTPLVTVGEAIAQLCFFQTDTPPEKPYCGQYVIEDWPLCMIPEKYRDRVVDPDKFRT